MQKLGFNQIEETGLEALKIPIPRTLKRPAAMLFKLKSIDPSIHTKPQIDAGSCS